MKLITLDTETFYDREYSLSKISTEEYVRSPLFETIGVAIKIDEEETTWYPQPQVEAALQAIDWSEALLLCQNTMFDAAILAWRYGVQPAGLADTMCMSRALYPHEKSHSLKTQAERMGIGQKGDEVVAALGKRYKDFDQESLARYGAYCVNDVELTHTLFKRYLDAGFPRQELRLIDLTIKMFTDPRLTLDRELLKDHLADVIAKKEALLSKLSADDKARLMSNPQLADMLREHGVEPPMKISPTTGKETYAFAKTDEAFKALLEHEDPEVQAIVAARLGVKSTLEETRTESLIAISYRGTLPVPLRYYGAHSSRWTAEGEGSTINLQNLPSRTAMAGRLKKAILAPEGYVFIDSDSSQIEARTLAWLAGQDDLVDVFMKNNEELARGVPKKEFKYDPYKLMAANIYGKPTDQITDGERFIGKSTLLGCGYRVGHIKLQASLKSFGVNISENEAKRIIAIYRSTYYKIPELWEKADVALHMLAAGMPFVIDTKGIMQVVPGKGITLPNKLYIQYPELSHTSDGWVYKSKKGIAYIYDGKVVENTCQGIARCIIAEQMLRITKRYKVVLTVHDAVACIAPEDEREEAMKYVEECMWWRPSWASGLPLACEAGWGASYGDC